MRDQDVRNIALVLFGVIPGFVPLVLMLPLQAEIAALLMMAIAMMLCLLVGVGVLHDRYRAYVTTKRRRQPFRIALLADMGEFKTGAEYYVWTDIGLQEWKGSIEKWAGSMQARVKIRLIKVAEKFDMYSAIINPYGGAYPEADLDKLETLSRIIRYVREGGIFVNVADVPTYWAYSDLLKRKVDNTPSTDLPISQGGMISIIPLRPFGRTPLIRQLGLQVINTEKNSPTQMLDSILSIKDIAYSVHRATLLESNVESCVPPFTLQGADTKREASSFVRVQYGSGYILLFLGWINDSSNVKVRDFIKDAISKCCFELLITQEKSSSKP